MKSGQEEEGWEVVDRRRNVKRRGLNERSNTGWRLGTTFLFRNFTEDCSKEDLWNKFSEVGKVEDLFLPNKRDRLGGRFGFVRLSKGGEDWEMLNNLNKIWFGSYIIRAFIPKHERGPGRRRVWPEVGGEARRQIYRRPQAWAPSQIRRENGGSYSEELRGPGREGGGENKEPESSKEEISFQSSEEEGMWHEGAFTGRLKDEFSWREHGEEISSECVGMLRLSVMGGNLILLQSSDEKSTKETLAGFDEWAAFWFDWLQPWRYFDVNCTRIVWTRWVGVPMQAWCSRFFNICCSQFGGFIELHEATKNRSRLDEAYVKISTGLETIDRNLSCSINGARFRIRVEEVRGDEQVGLPKIISEVDLSSESEISIDASEELDDVESIEAVAGVTEGLKQEEEEEEETVGGGGDASFPVPHSACAEISFPKKDVTDLIIEEDRRFVGGWVPRRFGVQESVCFFQFGGCGTDFPW